jgi:xanthine dehydrogenase iron-sulfur cluster and FAD-binding subunit A
MSPNPVVICGFYSPSFLRSPYAESRKTRNPSIHAVARNRSENQSTLVRASDSRYERTIHAEEPRQTAVRTYDQLTQVDPKRGSATPAGPNTSQEKR